tara:strand:+ start:205 stop:432 length:228 start_codon:yes stop_codon:yes gene_type:complete
MFDLGTSSVGSVNVMTSDKGGLTNEQVADLAVDKIVSISDEAPAHIRQQANQFREHLKKGCTIIYSWQEKKKEVV